MTAKIKLNAASGGGSVSLKAPSTTTSNAAVELQLPVADGTNGQVLKTDGSGNLSFAAATDNNTFVKLASTTVSSSTAQVDFTNSITGAFDTYKTYAVSITGLVPASDDLTLRARKFDSNGIYTTSEYSTKVAENASSYSYGGESTFQIIRQGVGNNSSGSEVYENFNGIFYFFNFEANNRFSMMGNMVYKNSSSATTFTTMGGTTNVTTATTGIRFFFASGNIATGIFTLYGISA